MRAIDVWVVLCYIGVFYALMEYCIVIYLTINNLTEKRAEKRDNMKLIQMNQTEDGTLVSNGSELKKIKKIEISAKIILATKLESFSRIVLPMYNILFSSCYFLVCILVFSESTESGELYV